LLCGTWIWCLYNTIKIPFIFICLDISTHFCCVFVAHIKISISNFHMETSDIHYMVFYSKNYIETCARYYFVNIKAYRNLLSCNILKVRTLEKSSSKIFLKKNLFVVPFLNVYDQGPKSQWKKKGKTLVE
jgi:hypothetical protein